MDGLTGLRLEAVREETVFFISGHVRHENDVRYSQAEGVDEEDGDVGKPVFVAA